MKYLPLLGALLLSAAPVVAEAPYAGGYFKGKGYVLTFSRFPETDHKYSVSVIESRSAKDKDGDIFPSSFAFECKNGKGEGFVAMGSDRSEASSNQSTRYYIVDFCNRNGYNWESEANQ